MGLYDTLFADVECPRCRRIISFVGHTKSLSWALLTLRAGDAVDAAGQDDGTVYAHGFCPRCSVELFSGFCVRAGHLAEAIEVLTREEACLRTDLPLRVRGTDSQGLFLSSIAQLPEAKESLLEGNLIAGSLICSRLGSLKRSDERSGSG